MSSNQIDNILASTLDIYHKELRDQWYEGNPALEAVMSKAKMAPESSGNEIITPIIVDGNPNIGSYKGYDALPTKPTNEFGTSRYPFRQFAGGVSTCGEEVCKNGGDRAIFNLVEMKVEVLRRSMLNYLSEMFLTSDGKGNNSKDIYGLPRLLGGITQPDKDGNVAPSYPELGGLDPTDPACDFWSAYIDDGGVQVALNQNLTPPPPRPLTEQLIFETMLCIAGNKHMSEMPDCILMSKKLFIDFRSQIAANLMPTMSNGVASTGFTGINWNGIRIVWDVNIPDDVVIFLNSEYLTWNYMSDCYMTPTDWVRPANQDARYKHILSMANWSTSKRKAHGILCNVRPLCKKG